MFLENKKILLWLDKGFVIFGIAKKLQAMENFDFFGIIDFTHDIKKFFNEQQMIKLKKSWHYIDNVSLSKPKVDLSYLESFEKKYDINLWSIIYAERSFYPQYNKYHTFTENEIFSLLTQECKFFEMVLDEVKPDFLFINPITRQHQILLHKICTKKAVKTLEIEPTHFGNKWIVTDEPLKMVHVKQYDLMKSKSNRTFEDLQKYLTSYKPLIFVNKPTSRYKISKIDKIKAASKFLSQNTENYERHYSTFGKSKSSIITKGTATMSNIKMKPKESFIENNFLKKIDDKIKFVYFPLAQEPERTLLMATPFYTNQPAVITNIAKSLPIGYELYVKEHPAMKFVGWRDISFYQQILDLPNVKLIHPSISQDEMIKKCSLVITINGTASIEAVFHRKPAIVFSHKSGYNVLSSVNTINKIEDLPSVIKQSLTQKISQDDLNKYVDYMEKYAIDYEQQDYSTELANRFNYSVGYMSKISIESKEIESFLSEYDSMFERLAKKYLELINAN